MSESSFAALRSLVAAARSSRHHREFSAVVEIEGVSGNSEKGKVSVDHQSGSWKFVSTGGHRFSYTREEGKTFRYRGETERGENDPSKRQRAVELFFPLEMPIWGAKWDLYRLESIKDYGDVIRVDLVDQESEDITAHPLFDKEAGVFIEFSAYWEKRRATKLRYGPQR